jgi:hypothetical protein
MSSSENEAWRDEMNPHSLLPKKKRSSIAQQQQTKKKKRAPFSVVLTNQISNEIRYFTASSTLLAHEGEGSSDKIQHFLKFVLRKVKESASI